MSRSRGICGFETGRTDAGYSIVGGALTSLVARTGNYAYQDKKTVAATNGFCTITTQGVADGGLFQLKLRGYFQPVTFPSSSGLYLITISGLNVRLEMNNLGQVRFNSSLTTAPAYSAQTILGHWYLCRLRLQGYNKLSGLDNSSRMRGLVELYDVGIDGTDQPTVSNLILDYATPDQTPALQANISCDGVVHQFGLAGNALQEMAGKIASFALTCDLSTPGGCGATADGIYSTFSSQVNAFGPGASLCTVPCTATNGTVREVGDLNGVNIQHFITTNAQLPITSIDINIGNTVDGVSCTREINYDDIYWDFQDGADVPALFADQFPLSTAVRPYPVTAQGFFDAFTPASSPGDVNNIPMDDVNTVASSTAPDKTSYLHADLVEGVGNIAEHLRVYVRWGGSANIQNLILVTAGSVIFSGNVLNEVGANGDLADFPFEGASYLTAEEFNDIEYGLRLAASSLTQLHSIFMEVLTGAQTQLEPADPFDVDAEIFPESLSPTVEGEITLSTGTLGFRLANRGEEINVPTTWRLERFDIGPRREEKA